MIFEQGANIVGVKKEINYVMTCAWAMQLDDDKIALLLGSQSVTARSINVGDVIGVNPLNSKQKEIALKIGDGHSNEINKLERVKFHYDDEAILIDDAKVNIKAKVIDILDPLNNGDKLIICHIISLIENEGEYLEFQKLNE